MIKFHHIIITLIVGMVIGWLCRPNRVEKVVEVQKDTVVYRDTTRIQSPAEIKYERQTDTILVPYYSTKVIHDTTYIVLPRESREYRGDDYFARVSGYDPTLDVIEVYPKTTSITNTERVKYHPKNRLTVGAEVHYFQSAYTPIYLEYERMLHKNVGIFAKFLYDIPNNTKGVGVGVEFTIGW